MVITIVDIGTHAEIKVHTVSQVLRHVPVESDVRNILVTVIILTFENQRIGGLVIRVVSGLYRKFLTAEHTLNNDTTLVDINKSLSFAIVFVLLVLAGKRSTNRSNTLNVRRPARSVFLE